MIDNKKIAGLLVLGGIVVGGATTASLAVHAQTATNTQATTTQEKQGGEKNWRGHNAVDQAATEAKATVKTVNAVATAEASAGEKSVRSHVEDENGVISYDVFFTDKKIEVDGTTGAITNTEAQSAHKGHFEKQNEPKDANGNDIETNDAGQ